MVIYLEKLNDWRSAQRERILPHGPLETELLVGRSVSFRAGRLVAASFALLMVVGAFVFFVFVRSNLDSKEAGVFASIVLLAITAALLKIAWSLIRESAGRTPLEERLLVRGRELEKQSKIMEAAACFAQSLTYPWQKRPIPHVYKVRQFHSKHHPGNKTDGLFSALTDLLFADLFLEVALNTGAFGGVGLEEKKHLSEFATDSGPLIEFCTILRKMDSHPRGEPFLREIAGKIRAKAPQMAFELTRPCDECGVPDTSRMNELGVMTPSHGLFASFECPHCHNNINVATHQINRTKGHRFSCTFCRKAAFIPASVWCKTCKAGLSRGWQDLIK